MNENMKYPPNPLAAFENGCLMDLRTRLAIELIKSPWATGAYVIAPADLASAAISTIHELFVDAEKRGWIEPLSDNGEINSAMRRHLERGVAAQLYQQEHSQKLQQEHGQKLQQAGQSLIAQARVFNG